MESICGRWRGSRAYAQLGFLDRATTRHGYVRFLTQKAHGDDYELFHYTSGRWVYNDSLRHDERRRLFNVSELKRLAAKSVQRQAEDVVHFRKLAEGGFNRTFLIGMRDGFQLVARIPYPVTVPKQLAVASESATLAFLHSQSIPVPRLYAYSPTADNAAGTEYMFMEFIRDKSLGDAWVDMTEENRHRLVASIVKLESRLFDLRFPASGSLYFTNDLSATTKKVPLLTDDSERPARFCVGPDTNLSLWYGRRAGLAVNRGPYEKPAAVVAAGAKKEIAYLQAFGRPLLPFHRIRRETFQCQEQLPLVHLETLEKYLQIIPSMFPMDNKTVTRPVIRHPDLQPNNILISDDFEVSSLIDWQHCSILPLFLQCGIPKSLDNFGDPVSQSLETPRLPQHIDSMSEDDRTEEVERFGKRQLHHFYVAETATKNPVHFNALIQDHSAARRRLYEQSGSPWEGDNITLKSGLVQTVRKWDQLVMGAAPCPISFGQDEADECARLEAEQRAADELEKASKDRLGIGPGGWVARESYDMVKEVTAAMKAEMMDGAESELDRATIRENWIYDDMDEDPYL